MKFPVTTGKNPVNPLDDLSRRLTKEHEDYLYGIGNRPPNSSLWFTVVLQGAFCAAVAGGLAFVVGACLGVEDGYALLGVIALGGLAGLWWCVRAMQRRGQRVKAEYVRHGGDPAGTSDLLFGAVVYKIMPDGRWKWPEPSSSSE